MKILIVEKSLTAKKFKEIDRVVKKRLKAGKIRDENPVYLIDSTDMGKKYYIKYLFRENAQARAFKCFFVLDTKANQKKYRSLDSHKIPNLDLKFGLPNFVDKKIMIYNMDNLHIIHKSFGWQQLCNIYIYRYFVNIDNEIDDLCVNDEYNVLCKYFDAANYDFSLPIFAYMLFSKCKSLFSQYASGSRVSKNNFALHIKGNDNISKNNNITEYISYLNKNFFDSNILGLGNSFPTEVDKKFTFPRIKAPLHLCSAKFNIKDIPVFLCGSSHEKSQSTLTNVCQSKIEQNLELPISFIYFNVNANVQSFLNINPPTNFYTIELLPNDDLPILNPNPKFEFKNLINEYIKYIENKISDEVREMDKKYKSEIFEKIYAEFCDDSVILGYIDHFIQEMLNTDYLNKDYINEVEKLILKLRYSDFVDIFNNCQKYDGRYYITEWKQFVQKCKPSIQYDLYGKIVDRNKYFNKLLDKMQKRYHEMLLNEYIQTKSYKPKFFDNLYKEAEKILKNNKTYPIQVKRWSFLLASMISFKNYIYECLPERSENFDKYFQEFKDIAIKVCNTPPDRDIDNATALSEFSAFLKSEINNNAIIDIELGTNSDTGWIDYNAKEIYLDNSRSKDFYKKFMRYLKDRGEHIKLSKRAFNRDVLKANEIIESYITSQKSHVERYDYERRIGGQPYRVLVLDCERLNIQ